MKATNTVPRIVISSYKGKAGKTIATLALMASLTRLGLKVSPFKIGPDYIDPSYHRAISGRPSRNLDYILMGNAVLGRFHKYSLGSDIAVIEGVGGLYDSPDGLSELGSTAHLAKMLKAPVVLVINGERVNRTVRALVRGLRGFDPGVKVVGAILTNVVEGQVEKLKRAIEDEGLTYLGHIPRSRRIEEAFRYRHLGLTPMGEVEAEAIFDLINDASKGVDAQEAFRLAKEYSEPLEVEVHEEAKVAKGSLRIGILTGRAFTFYYPETLEEAYMMGDVRFIDPERDQELGDLDILLIGGGFPEVYGEGLERNRPLRLAVRRFVEGGGFLYAECGGLMYLSNSIIYNNEEYEMVGAIDAVAVMLNKPLWHGYAFAKVIKRSIIADEGVVLKGHEFHYSRLITLSKYEYSIRYERGVGIGGLDGIQVNNAYAHYLHIHPETYDYLGKIRERYLQLKSRPT